MENLLLQLDMLRHAGTSGTEVTESHLVYGFESSACNSFVAAGESNVANAMDTVSTVQ